MTARTQRIMWTDRSAVNMWGRSRGDSEQEHGSDKGLNKAEKHAQVKCSTQDFMNGYHAPTVYTYYLLKPHENYRKGTFLWIPKDKEATSVGRRCEHIFKSQSGRSEQLALAERKN